MVQLRQSAAPSAGWTKNGKDLTIMKKLLIALLLVLSCVLLFACVQSGPVTDTTAPSDESTSGATDTPTEAPTEAPTEQETFLPDDPNADYVYIKVQNPIHEGGCDPWVYLHEGSYYYCYSRGRGISVAKKPSLHTLVPKGTAVFDPPRGMEYSEELWAPELHYINGEWYIYVAA